MASFWPNNNTVTLYHYTTANGADGIVRNKRIKKSIEMSGRRDAAFGEGVYLTELTPDTAKQEIAANNYDGRRLDRTVAKFIRQGRIDYYIEVVLQANDPNLVQCYDQSQRLMAMNRNVWLYRGDIDLNFVVKWDYGQTGASASIMF